MPQVARPHPLHGVASHELGEDGVYAVAKPAQEGAPPGGGIALLAPARREELDARATRQFLLRFGRPVVAVADGEPFGGLDDELRHDGEIVGVGRGQREAGDEARPADTTHVHPETVEGLPEKRVFAESGLSPETAAAVGSGEKARRRQGERVHQGEGGVVGGVGQELLPEALLDLPEVGGLPGEGGLLCTSPSAGNHPP